MSQIYKLLWTFSAISCIALLYFFSPLLAITVILFSAFGYLYFDYERQQGRAVLVHADKFTQNLKLARSWFLNKCINRQPLSESISSFGLPRSMPSRSTYSAINNSRSMSNSQYDQNPNLNLDENSIRRRAGVGNFHRISSPGDSFQAMSPINRDPNTSNDFRNLSINDSRHSALAACRNHSAYLSPILHGSSHQKTPESLSRNVQTLGGPLLASTRYNLSSESALFADVNSPGLSSRIARLSEDSRANSQPATHLAQYAGPGQFPTVHLGPTSRLPVMSLRSTQKTSRAAVRLRMSPRPLPSETLVPSDRCLAMSEPAQPARSVLDTLHELSRKRLHAQLGEPIEETTKKQRTEELEMETTKRGREDSPEPEQNMKRPCGNEITSSLSSSRLIVERAAKRKTSEDVTDGLSAVSAGKIAKTSEPIVVQPLPAPVIDEDHSMQEPLPVEQKPKERPAMVGPTPMVQGSHKAPGLALDWRRQDFLMSAEGLALAERVRLRDLRSKKENDIKMRLHGMMTIIAGTTEPDGPTPTAPVVEVPPPTEANTAKPATKHVTFAENLAEVKTYDGAGDSASEPTPTVAQVSVTASLTNPIVSTGLATPSTTPKLDGFSGAFDLAKTLAPLAPSVLVTQDAAKITAATTTFTTPSTFNIATTSAATISSPSIFDVAKGTTAAPTFSSPSPFTVASTSVATPTLTSPSTLNIAKTTSTAISFSSQSTLATTTASTFPSLSTFSVANVAGAAESGKPASGFGALTTTPFAFEAKNTVTTASSTFGVTSVSFGAKTSAPITFGEKLTAPVTFGDKSTTPITFGDKTATPISFGTKPAAPIALGEKPSAAVTFGSAFGGAPPPYPTTTAQDTPAFGFGAASAVSPPPPYAPTTSASFGQTASAGGFSFGSTKPGGSTFSSNVTFGQNKDTPVFGANKESPFGTANKTEVAVFGAKEKALTFGAKPEPVSFGTAKPNTFQFSAATTTAGGFGFDVAKPAFGVASNGPTTTTSTFAFGATTTPKSFGFGENGSAFGATPSGFGAVTTTAAPAPADSLFTFGQTAAKPAATGGFGFGGGTQLQPAAAAAGGFSFGNTTAPAATFGASSAPAFGTSSPATPAFGASTTTTPAFGVNAAAPPAFGAGSTPTFGVSANPTPAFGASSTSLPAFGASSTTTPAFGAVAAPSFGTGTSFGTATPATNAFQFGAAPTAAPAVGGFNFSGGAAPVSFGAPAQGNAFQAGGVAQFGAAPAPGMFSIGTGSSGPRGRQVRSRRR